MEKHEMEKGTVEALMQVKKTLDKYHLTYWLDQGTLLGAVRDQQILPWDIDVDLFFIKKQEDFEKIVQAFEELSKKGFEVCYFWDKGMINLRKKDSIYISNHFLTIEEDKAFFMINRPLNFKGQILSTFWWILSAAKSKRKESQLIAKSLSIVIRRRGKSLQEKKMKLLPIRSLFTLLILLFRLVPFKQKLLKFIFTKSKKHCKQLKYTFPAKDYQSFKDIYFYKEKFKIPANYQDHLETLYGKDWTQPKPNWGREQYGSAYKQRISQ